MLDDLLQPRTDGGVVAQVVLVLVLGVAAAIATRRDRRTWWPLVGGATFFTLGLMVLRAAH